MLTFPNPGKLSLDSYLRVNIIVRLLDAQAESMPALKVDWSCCGVTHPLRTHESRSRDAGLPITWGWQPLPATWEAPAACCYFPAAMVGGQSGELV